MKLGTYSVTVIKLTCTSKYVLVRLKWLSRWTVAIFDGPTFKNVSSAVCLLFHVLLNKQELSSCIKVVDRYGTKGDTFPNIWTGGVCICCFHHILFSSFTNGRPKSINLSASLYNIQGLIGIHYTVSGRITSHSGGEHRPTYTCIVINERNF